MSGLARSAEAWGSRYAPPETVSEENIADLELELGVVFPKDCRDSVIAVGAPKPTTELWEWLSDEDDRLGYADGPRRRALHEFLTPQGIREAVEWRNAGRFDSICT